MTRLKALLKKADKAAVIGMTAAAEAFRLLIMLLHFLQPQMHQ